MVTPFWHLFNYKTLVKRSILLDLNRKFEFKRINSYSVFSDELANRCRASGLVVFHTLILIIHLTCKI